MRSCCNRECLGARALDASERFTTHGVKASWHARYTLGIRSLNSTLCSTVRRRSLATAPWWVRYGGGGGGGTSTKAMLLEAAVRDERGSS